MQRGVATAAVAFRSCDGRGGAARLPMRVLCGAACLASAVGWSEVSIRTGAVVAGASPRTAAAALARGDAPLRPAWRSLGVCAAGSSAANKATKVRGKGSGWR